jgi:ATP/ADP translocase
MLSSLCQVRLQYVCRVTCSIKKPQEVKPPRKKKKKGSLGESFAVLKSSPKILSLAMLVMSYGVSHRLFEFAWKGQLRVLFPSAQAYQVTAMPICV